MKVLVTYYSETGNTEKVARAIFDGVQKAEKDLFPIGDVDGVEDYDLIFVGFPVHANSVPPGVEPFLRAIPEGKKVALFATHGSLRGGKLATTAFEYAMSLASKARIIGTFSCRGKVKASLLEELLKKPEHAAWAEEAQSSAATHPDDADLAEGEAFGRKMAKKVRTEP